MKNVLQTEEKARPTKVKWPEQTKKEYKTVGKAGREEK